MGHHLVTDLKSLSQSFWRHIWGSFMGKVTGSASSDTVKSELHTNFVIWKMSQPNAVALQLHAGADVLTGAPGHSVLFLGAILGWGNL